MNRKIIPLIGFLYITVLSAAFNTLSEVGDTVEHIIQFLSPMIMFFVVIALFSKFRGITIFSKQESKLIAVSFVAITIADYLYPPLRYWDQDFGSMHYTMFFIEISVNAAIARMISND